MFCAFSIWWFFSFLIFFCFYFREQLLWRNHLLLYGLVWFKPAPRSQHTSDTVFGARSFHIVFKGFQYFARLLFYLYLPSRSSPLHFISIASLPSQSAVFDLLCVAPFGKSALRTAGVKAHVHLGFVFNLSGDFEPQHLQPYLNDFNKAICIWK